MTRKTRRDAAAEAFHAVLAQSENRDAEDATTHGETPKDGGGKKKKPSKSKAEAACDETAPLGSAKAVDTLFRNAIRAELDIINLAAMKANIMISLNGLIISALMISGAFIFASSQVFILPAGVFMLTAAASIFFALLAASPDRIDALRGIWRWLGAVVQRRARLRDWRSFADDARQATAGEGDLNLLIYEDRVRLDPREYWERMQTMLRNRDEVYYRMSDQLYWLGKMADRKFRLLDMSYRAFRWGLLASVVVFLSVKSLFGMFPALSGQVAAPMGNLGIAEFSDIYEPSAVQQLPDGRILVVEDEATRAFSIMTLAPDGSLIEDTAADQRLTRSFGRKLSDLEGLSLDDRGNVYAITSHSTNAKGERRPDREQLLRFQITGGQAHQIASVTGLRDALLGDSQLHQRISEGAGGGAEVKLDRLNIEGLAYHKATGELMLGLRDPRVADLSVIVPVTNPDAMFGGAAPVFGPPALLDLDDGGIRALSYDPVLAAFLIVNEVEGASGEKISQLWSWDGTPGGAPVRVALPGIINLNNVESIDSIIFNDSPRLLLMSDEGDAKLNIPAKYLMLDYDQIKRN